MSDQQHEHAASPSKRRFGPLDLIEWIGNKLPEPTTLFVLGAALVMVLSQVGVWQGWEVQPKRLVPATEVVLDAAGQPVIDPVTGQPQRQPVIGPDGKPILELVATNAPPIRARSLLTGDGLYWAISSLVDNFVRFPPLGIVLVGMLGIGLAERVGFIGAALKAFMLVVPPRLLTPTMVFLGIMSSLGTDAGYVVLPPVAAVLYKAAGRSPLAGIAAVFAGVAAGFNANLLITSLDPLLAGFTGPAAQTIDPAYQVNPACNWWFMIASTVLITLTGWGVTSFIVERRLRGKSPEEGGPVQVSAEEVAAQKLTRAEIRGLAWGSAAVVAVTAVFVAFVVVPGAPMDDYLRGPSGAAVTRADVEAVIAGNPAGDSRIADLAAGPLAGRDLEALAASVRKPGDAIRDPAKRLPDSVRGPGLGDHFDRWVESIVPMLFLVFIVPGIAYGLVTGAVRSGRDATKIMVDTMAYMAPVIVLAFFAAQFIEYFKFSNLDKMLAYTGGQWLAGSKMGPFMLIVSFIALTAVFNLFIGSMSAKYAMFAPIFVPMLMLAGIAPELTQAAYRIGDSVSNVITPLNAYLVIILVVMQKYAPRAGMGTLISMMMPYTIIFGIVWTIMLLAWMQLGLPLGIDGPLYYTGATH